MPQSIDLPLPVASYHSEEASQLRVAAQAAVDDFNERLRAYIDETAAVLASDLSETDAGEIFDREFRRRQFVLTQDEAKARKLCDVFLEKHRLEAHAAVVSQGGVTSAVLIEANRHMASEDWLNNRNRLGSLSDVLGVFVRRYLTL